MLIWPNTIVDMSLLLWFNSWSLLYQRLNADMASFILLAMLFPIELKDTRPGSPFSLVLSGMCFLQDLLPLFVGANAFENQARSWCRSAIIQQVEASKSWLSNIHDSQVLFPHITSIKWKITSSLQLPLQISSLSLRKIIGHLEHLIVSERLKATTIQLTPDLLIANRWKHLGVVSASVKHMPSTGAFSLGFKSKWAPIKWLYQIPHSH